MYSNFKTCKILKVISLEQHADLDISVYYNNGVVIGDKKNGDLRLNCL